MRKVGLLIILLVVLGGTIILFGRNVFKKPSTQTTTTQSTSTIPTLREPTITIIDPVRGPKDAPITIVEFGDYLCDFCRQMEPTVREVLATYPTSVRLVWKDFPNDAFHPGATNAAEAARCAGAQGKYWAYHDLLLAQTGYGIIPHADLATAADLETTAFNECLAAGFMKPVVEHTSREAQGLGLTGAPSFFINGVPFDGTTFSEFQTVIEKTVEASS